MFRIMISLANSINFCSKSIGAACAIFRIHLLFYFRAIFCFFLMRISAPPLRPPRVFSLRAPPNILLPTTTTDWESVGTVALWGEREREGGWKGWGWEEAWWRAVGPPHDPLPRATGREQRAETVMNSYEWRALRAERVANEMQSDQSLGWSDHAKRWSDHPWGGPSLEAVRPPAVATPPGVNQTARTNGVSKMPAARVRTATIGRGIRFS